MMTEAKLEAVVVHRMKGRARMRLQLEQGVGPVLQTMERTLAEHVDVTDVQTSLRAQSVLLLHEGPLEPILEHLTSRCGIAIVTIPTHAPMSELQRALEGMDAVVAAATRHRTSLGGLAFVGLITAALWQVRRGNLFAASTTLFKDALKVMEWVAEREPSMSQSRRGDVSRS